MTPVSFSTALTRALSLKYPFVQAPCAGHTTPDLVAAVSNAGGLGSLGGAMMNATDLRAAIQAIKAKTSLPFAVNLFCRPERPPTNAELHAPLEVDNHLNAIRSELGLPTPTEYKMRSPPLDQQIAVILEERVPVVSYTFGYLSDCELRRLWGAGIYLIGTATTVREALFLAGMDPSDPTRKADAVVAQGTEAGGHRGTFLKEDVSEQMPTAELVKKVRQAFKRSNGVSVNVPILAAGGISNGETASKALHDWQADGVVMGTLFMLSTDSSTKPVHRKIMLSPDQPETLLTAGLTGRSARGFKNVFMDKMKDIATPSYDIHSARTADIVAASVKAGNPDYMMLWSGANSLDAAEYTEQGTLSAAEVMAKLVKDCEK
ncbi:2-nitropropane dioxygenase [Syncephalastrum racemosum]|uniref:2-nitropropane dioxygenase n=1 Tax=Syncephalastrum racemosum TaxID=13706 RepID=A0A1X2H3Y7_SYNRA|nr:2-nitropropane dioxygenase [Syncephalastrum racemosum]